MGKDTLASSRTLFFTSNKMVPHTRFPAQRLLTIPSIRLLLLLLAKLLRLPTSPSARRGTHTSLSAKSHATNSWWPSTMFFYAEIDDPTKGLNTISLCNLVTHIHSTYATISQPNVDNNMAKFVTGTKPSLPLAVYTRKQEKCQTFAQDASVPFSEATMVTTGTKATLNCGGMGLAWRKQKCCPLIDHMWNNWKLHWTAASCKNT
jgi:hypothetical protein